MMTYTYADDAMERCPAAALLHLNGAGRGIGLA
jgi:hypothetical protein